MSSPVLPSSTSVLHKLNEQVFRPVTVSACLEAVSSLSESERKVLVESPAKYQLVSTDKEAFTTAAVQALASDDLDQVLGDAASGASAAVHGIIELMFALLLNLARADTMNGTHLTEEYEPILRLYYETMRDGIPLSNTIAQYAEDFDNKIIEFCADGSLTIDVRLLTILEYIKVAQGYQTTADEMHSTLESVFDKTLDFVDQLGSQSLLKPDAKDEKEAKTVRARRTSAKTIFSAGSAGPLDAKVPALKVALVSPFGRYVMVAGLLGVANAEAINAAFSLAASMANWEYVPIDRVMSDLATRSGSGTDTNTEYFNEFREHIEVLAGYWQSALVDAREIELWLNDGASSVDMPTYMNMALNEGAKIYVEVGKYLRLYAEETNQIPWDEWLNADKRIRN
ncbi:hypothetical protein CBS115989_7750 [Aspergillus niger]|uniref:Uncharacterized protein n=2 Tax=Aspergillus niger TaxID=5061 RepID=A0A9W5ZZD4_ASPNG|nr:hypothetical protein CBS115989_7750 [Aspergillus niger]RDH18025.1 hypothetical protein M747DRAFT_263542 [Aspergillus niger ATCC 13496]KAI2862254.1 hypothetical protein CBS11232_475 [Aspergillus niger]KAI2882118.1 hypothetical protein CBS115988_45 [Aspergillus niger]KAI2888145.1 hypothetical protein CBS11852_7344 [Aspergillus niger]|eukprot:XP_001395452.2 hypothetical protein ANI_1_1702104 [Aspergillus niger CBS 513.88]